LDSRSYVCWGVFAIAASPKHGGIDAVKLYVLPAGPIQTNAYLLTATDRGEAVLIDAPGGIWSEIEPILARDKCKLTELWLTHGHWDHTQGGAEVVRATQAKVRAHLADRAMIETPEIMERFMGERMNLEAIHVDFWIKQGDRIPVLGTTAEVRHVPGHCPGNVLFHFSDFMGAATGAASGVAFVGDALFNGSIGRTDLPGGSFDQLAQSIREQIYTLPDSTLVFSGHGPKTTVGNEKEGNPYVSG
jgi:hydroxyacylglutathione hydrolase